MSGAILHSTSSAGLGVNPARILWDVFYGMANSFTQIVGLTPLQVVLGIVGLILLVAFAQLYMAYTGKTGWHLDDVRDDVELAKRMRKELDRG
jgi:hypothetical protein